MELISNKSNPVLSGMLLTLTCAVELSPAVDVPVAIRTTWIGPDGSTLMYTNLPARLSFTHYITTAVLKGIDLADSGEYTCTTDIGNEITVSANTSVTVGRCVISILLFFHYDGCCRQWDVSTEAKTNGRLSTLDSKCTQFN